MQANQESRLRSWVTEGGTFQVFSNPVTWFITKTVIGWWTKFVDCFSQ
jgi:hypothetical protein